MKKIAPGVYVETKYKSGNVGIIVTGSGVVAQPLTISDASMRHWW